MSCCMNQPYPCRGYPPQERQSRNPHINKNQSFDSIDPPSDLNENWDRQYCKWSGWTWVKKTDKEVICQNSSQNQTVQQKPSQTSSKKQKCKSKKNGCFSCFKKKKSVKSDTKVSVNEAPPPQPPPVHKTDIGSVGRESDSESFDDCGYCCCDMEFECCCCSCHLPCCCCCCGGDSRSQKYKCCNTETQTVREVKEQATKMSHLNIPKRKNGSGMRCRRCRCRKPICCPCCRNVCPCIQPKCCPCKQNQPKNSQSNNNWNSQSDMKQIKSNSSKIDTDKLINYCLRTTAYKKPNPLDFLNRKTNNFSTLHKSLDILLKNNINILNLIDVKKELKTDISPLSVFNSNHTITGIGSNSCKKTDSEHCNLLTAVCDAILSSHKLDEKLNSSPGHLHEVLSNRGIVEKLLDDVNYPFSRSDDRLNQDKPNPVRIQSRKSLSKLFKTRSRILAAARLPRRTESLRKSIDLAKYGVKNRDYKSTRGETKRNCESPINFFRGESQSSVPRNTTSRLDNLEILLHSLDYEHDSSGRIKERNSSNLHHRNSLLNATSPTFTTSDLLLNLEDSKIALSQKDEKRSSSD